MNAYADRVDRPFPSLEVLARALGEVPTPEPAGAELEAAVLACLHDRSLLLIRRQEVDGDRWSGHVALPGGRHEPADATLLRTALRETEEEVGFAPLEHGEVLGSAGVIESSRLRVRLAVFVARLDRRPELLLSDEVTAAYWVELESLRPSTAAVPEYAAAVPAYLIDAGGHELIVWGLTYRVLEELRALA
jgi:8-oxo-dGTP pyrophosphatase MutT (NUDIX family)